jgi:hypothetical protein
VKISELRKNLVAKRSAEESKPVSSPTIITYPAGTASRQLTDPYWDSRRRDSNPNVPESQFTQSLRYHAEKSGRRVTPAASTVAQESEPKLAVPLVSSPAKWPGTTGQLADFFEAIDEASEKFASSAPCAYCGVTGTDKNGCCPYCARLLNAGQMTAEPLAKSAKLVHLAGDKLDVPYRHAIFVVDDIGTVRQHYIQHRTDGRTLINLDGREIDV